MKIVWSAEAIIGLTVLREFIAAYNPDAALRVALAIINTIELRLCEQPELGRPGRVPDTRELAVPNTPVVIPYRVRDDTLEILAVFHHARSWPDHF